MTTEQYQEHIAQLQRIQNRCAAMENVIFSMSVSSTQVRALVFTKIAPSRSFFLYKEADDTEGKKVLSRMEEYFDITVDGWKEETECM